MNEQKSSFFSQCCSVCLYLRTAILLCQFLEIPHPTVFRFIERETHFSARKKFQKVIPRREMGFLCREIPLPSSWSELTGNLLTVPAKTPGFVKICCSYPPKDTTSNLKRKVKVDIQSLWGCLGWLCLLFILFQCFGCYHFEMCETCRYQCMSPHLKGNLHSWLFCFSLSEFPLGSMVRISTLAWNLLWLPVPFTFPFNCGIDWLLQHFLKVT